MMRVCGLLLLSLALAGCSAEREPLQPAFIADGNPAVLSEWGMIEADGTVLTLAADVVPYDLNSALFSDYAHKLRTIWMPEGVQATYREGEVLDFPVGTVITKTFYYPRGAAENEVVRDLSSTQGERPDGLDLAQVRLIETRILARREAGWIALPYVWNEAQDEAVLRRAGHIERLTLVDGEAGREDGREDFAYAVPNANQCAGCHAVDNTSRAIQPIGPAPRYLNRDFTWDGERRHQLDRLVAAGYLDTWPGLAATPAAADAADPAMPLDARARSYLDINCAHCHNPVGPADTSGLHLNHDAPVGPNLGLCKLPIAAGGGTGGRRVSIAPGAPDDSILLFRMETNDPGAMMPELGRAVRDETGIALIRDWIASLPGNCGD